MTFATPIIAAIVAGIVIPTLIILYFLKLRRRDMEVSSTLLWKKAIQDLQANAPFQKLRNNILLILQLLALLAALFAIAQPELRHRGLSNSRKIIMIDRSASMNATDGNAEPEDAVRPPPAGGDATGGSTDADAAKPKGPTRLEAARKKALELINSLREPTLFDDKAEEAMIIAFDSTAEVVQTFTPNKAVLKDALDKITPSDAPSSLERAYDLARAYTGTRKFEDQVNPTPGVGFVPSGPGAAIYIYSDGRLPDAEKIQTAPEDQVVYQAIGSPDAPNIGVTGLRAERSFDNPGRVTVFVGLQSTDTIARTVDVELSIDGAPVGVTPTRVPAATQPVGTDSAREETPDPSNPGGAPATTSRPRLVPGIGGFVVPIERAQGGIAQVRILPGDRDALPTDNTAFLTIPPAPRLAAVLVTNGNLFIKTAIDGLGLSKFDIKTPAEFQDLLDKGQTAQYDVFIFDRVLPLVEVTEGAVKKKVAALPPGRSLVLGAVPPPPLGVIDEGTGKGELILTYARDHPALRLASLDKVYVSTFRKTRIAPDTPVKEIAKAESGPAIVEVSDATTDAIIVPWDVADSNWPFEPGWVLFLAGSILHLSETNSGALSEGIRCGDTLTTRLPQGAHDVRLNLASGESVRVEPGPDGTISFGPITSIGMYTVSWEGPGTAADEVDGSSVKRRIAANLLDPAESDVGTVLKLEMARGVIQSQSEKESDLTRKLWPYLLLGALGVMLLEWFVYNRKVAL